MDICLRRVVGKRRNLLPQSKVFDHKIGSAPTHRPDRTGAERDEEDENTEHSGRVWPSFSLNSSGRTARESLISRADIY